MPGNALRRLLPDGTLAVGAGLGVLGVGAFAHLGIAGHALDDVGMSALSVLWSVSLVASQGLFLPIEQEITRLVAARAARGDGAGYVIRRAAALCAVVLAVLLAALLLATGPLTDRLFGGDPAQVWILAGSVAAFAVAHVARGILAGRGHLGWYGAQLGLDGGLRILVAGALWLAGVESAAAYGAVLILAPALAAAATLRPALRPDRPGPLVAWPTLVKGLGLLTVATLMAQLVVNMPVVNARLLAPADAAFVAALLAALVLVRLPLFLFGSLQAALLPGLSAALAAGDERAWRRLLVRALGVVTALAGAAGVVGVVAGPALIRVFFDAPDVLGRADFALLAAGTLAYLWALVLGQGVLVRGRHLDQAAAWVAGGALLVAVTLAPGDVALRVELGYTAGAALVAVVLALVLLLRRHPSGRTGARGLAGTAAVAAGGGR
ncbi:MAG: polysaccharide biosynthesis protein [Micromonosporaceae bacterium]